MADSIPARLSPAEGRRFALTVGAALLVLGAVIRWRGGMIVSLVVLVLGAGLVLAGLVVPGHLTAVHRAWMNLALAISKVTTPIILAVVYFLVITPVGIVRRMLGRDALTRPRSRTSFWVPRTHGGRSDLERQF